MVIIASLATGAWAMLSLGKLAAQVFLFTVTAALFLAPWGLRWAFAKPWVLIPSACLIALMWFSGLDAPPKWDGCQSYARGYILWHEGRLRRFSLFYILLAPLTGPMASAIPAHLFIRLVGMLALLFMGLSAAMIAGKRAGLFAGFFLALLIPFFHIYHYIMPDTWLVMLWSMAIWLAMRWGRRITPLRIAGLFFLIGAAAASKEMGALIVIPIAAALILLSPPGAKRRRRVAVAMGMVAIAMVIGALVVARYGADKQIDFFDGIIGSGKGLTFLPFNDGFERDGWTKAFWQMIRHHNSLWAQTGLIVPIVFALFQPIRHWAGATLLLAGLAAQALWLIASRLTHFTHIPGFPFFANQLKEEAFFPFMAYGVLTAVLWGVGALRWNPGRRSWAPMLATAMTTLAFVIFVKAQPHDNGKVSVWLAWHYTPIIILGGAILSCRGFRRIIRDNRSGIWRVSADFFLVLVMMANLTHSVAVTAYVQRISYGTLEAYRVIEESPRRVVYTRWPQASVGTLDAKSNIGPFLWGSNDWWVRNVYNLRNQSHESPIGSVLFFDRGRESTDYDDVIKQRGEILEIIPIENWLFALGSKELREKHREAVTARVLRKYPVQKDE